MNWQYPLIMSIAIGTGLALSRRSQADWSLSPLEKLGLAIGGFCGAMIGAKLPFVLSDSAGLLSGAPWFSDGKTIMFGFVGGYAGIELAKWSLELHVRTGDSFAVPVALSIAIGRLACYAAGCCYGTPTNLPWGVNFGDGIIRHPTQIYESLFHLACAAVLASLHREKLFQGQLIKLYFITYFIYRFLTEFIRPEPRLWGGLTGYQWAALALIPLFAALWRHDAQRKSGFPA